VPALGAGLFLAVGLILMLELGSRRSRMETEEPAPDASRGVGSTPDYAQSRN
jgi:hypothetical protein